MGRFAVKRIAQGLVVVIGVSIVVFVVTRLIGDPIKFLLPIEATPEQRAVAEHQYGFDRPLHVQFVDYFGDLARLDFGESLWQKRGALGIVLERLPRTFQLVFPAIILAVLLSVPLGVLAALKPGKFLDRFTVVASLAGLSLPQFVLALWLIILFSVQLGWLPTSGAGSVRHAILPVVALALPAMGRLAMIVRSSMIDELNQQYVKQATAKGMPFARIVGVHALRNASIPALTLAGWELIRALAGYTVVVEGVFAWPGIGDLALEAIKRQDLFLLQAIVFVVALLVVIINIAVDLGYKAVDPRIKVEA